MALAKKTLLMIMVDALRHDYITKEHTPFLFRLSQNGAHGSLIPSFGFEPDGAYLAGLDPEECDGGAQYWHNPNERVFYLTGIFRLLYSLPTKWWRTNIRRALRLIAQLKATQPMTRKIATTSYIPISLLRHFSFSMQKLPTDSGFMPQSTIFDVLRDNNIGFFFHSHPLHKVRIELVVDRYISESLPETSFAFLFVGTLDGIGHRYGPNSPELHDVLGQVDRGLERIYNHAASLYGQVEMLVFGDHGMVDVTQTVDLSEAIKEAELDPKEDLYFLDSTFARFWVSSEERRNRLTDILNKKTGGHVLTEEEIDRFCIRYPHNYFWDIIFAVDDAGLIHPSFYCEDDHPPKGMHGYLPGCRDNESAFVLSSSRASGLGDLGRIDMRRIFPTVLDLMNLKDSYHIPHNLKSLFE